MIDALKTYIESLCSPPPDEWNYMIKLLTAHTYKKGELIVRAGDLCREVGFVTHGLARIYYTVPSGEEFTRSFCPEGTPVAPYSAIIRGAPSDVSIDALAPTTMLSLPYDRIVEAYDRHRCWLDYGRRLAERYLVVREHRELQLATLTAAERYEQFLAEFPGLSAQVPQYQIASFLGVTPVSLSRIVKARG